MTVHVQPKMQERRRRIRAGGSQAAEEDIGCASHPPPRPLSMRLRVICLTEPALAQHDAFPFVGRASGADLPQQRPQSSWAACVVAKGHQWMTWGNVAAHTGEPGVPAYLGHEPAVAIEELQLIRVDTRCAHLGSVNVVTKPCQALFAAD